MTILYIKRSMVEIGGFERILVDKMNYCAEKLNYEVWFVTFEQANRPLVFDLSTKIHYLDLAIPTYKEYNFNIIKRLFYHKKMLKLICEKMRSIISTEGIDIIIGNSYDMIIIETLFCMRHYTKTIIESHSSKEFIKEPDIYKKEIIIKTIINKFISLKKNYLFNKMSAFVTLTEADANAWKNLKNCVVIPNFIRFFTSQTKNKKIENRTVISVGRLNYLKGFDRLIYAWNIVHKKHDKWNLIIYGDGSEKKRLEEKISQLNLNKTIFLNHAIPNIYDKYIESDFFVLTSRSEGFGIVLIEAMSSGIPCISFNCPYGPAEIIKDKVDGFLVENGNINQLAKKICILIENREKRILFGDNAKQNVKRFAPETIMTKWKELFESLVSK